MPSYPSRTGFRLARQTPVIGKDGKRRCACCRAYLDPVDWCPYCQMLRSPCNRPHRRLRKHAAAAFCGDACRDAHRTSTITNINRQNRRRRNVK